MEVTDDYFDQTVKILRPEHVKGVTLATVRRYVLGGAILAHVKVMPAAEVARHRMNGADLSHNLWFQSDPLTDETCRFMWRGTVLRPAGPAADLHGLGEIWMLSAKALTVDNETVEVVQ